MKWIIASRAESALEGEGGAWLESLQILKEEICVFSSVFKKEKQELEKPLKGSVKIYSGCRTASHNNFNMHHPEAPNWPGVGRAFRPAESPAFSIF